MTGCICFLKYADVCPVIVHSLHDKKIKIVKATLSGVWVCVLNNYKQKQNTYQGCCDGLLRSWLNLDIFFF